MTRKLIVVQNDARFLHPHLATVKPGLDSRADSNIFRYNTCVGNIGAGIRIGGHKIGDKQYGENNEVYGNILQDNEYAGVKIMVRAEYGRRRGCLSAAISSVPKNNIIMIISLVIIN